MLDYVIESEFGREFSGFSTRHFLKLGSISVFPVVCFIHTSDLNIGTLVATQPHALCNSARTGTGWPITSIL